MPVTVEEIGKYLGQVIEDSMGRTSGKLVGLTADIKGHVQAVQVVQNDGDVSEYPIDSVRLVQGRPMLLPVWRVEADSVIREHDIAKRRRQALDLLLKDGDIDQAAYNQLRNNYEGLQKEILSRREQLSNTLEQVQARLEQQITDLEVVLTNNKMLFTASEIDEQTYHEVTGSIRAGLEIARKETKDLDNTRGSLKEMDSQETSFPSPPTSQKPAEKVPDVVVIKMKEST